MKEKMMLILIVGILALGGFRVSAFKLDIEDIRNINIKEKCLLNNINGQSGLQEEWNKTYGGRNEERAYSGQQISDGGYIHVGFTRSYGNGEADILMIKTNENGDELWNKTFGGANNDYATTVFETSDGGFIIGGHTISYGSSFDIIIIRTDSEGTLIWNKIFRGDMNDFCHAICQTFDEGFVVTGDYGLPSNNYYNSDLWLIKMDSNGNEMWNKTYGGENFDYGTSVIETVEGYLVIFGGSESFGTDSQDYWLLKTDSLGNIVWNKTFGTEFIDVATSFQQTNDLGFILAGKTLYSWDSGSSQNIWLLKTDDKGNLLWNKSIDNGNNCEGDNILMGEGSIKQTLDYGYIICCGILASYGTAIRFIKTDSTGNILWEMIIDGKYDDEPSAVLQSIDNGYLIIGSTQSYGSGSFDTWLVKFSAYDNQRPNKPSRPSGQTNGKKGVEYIYTTSTTDPDGDDVFYLFDWGDGSTSFILGPYESGAECSASGIWFEEGSYEIKVKSIDDHGAESDWSDPLVVTMPKNMIIYQLLFLCRFLEQHPRLVPLLIRLLRL